MRKFLVLSAVIALLAGWATPALADGFGISPAEVEFEVPADASQKVDFMAYNFSGNLEISLENIPLRVEPTTIPINAPASGVKISLTFYGDESLGSRIYQGKIRFLASTGSMVATGIKVRATVTNMVEGETPVLVEPQPQLTAPPSQQETTSSPSTSSQNPSTESQGVTILPSENNPEQEGSGKAPLPPAPPSNGGLPVIAVIGIAVGGILIILLIIVISRRPKY